MLYFFPYVSLFHMPVLILSFFEIVSNFVINIF